MKYRIVGIRGSETIRTTIEVPDHLPYYDPNDQDDVPLFIHRTLELDTLEDYFEEIS